MRLVTTMDLWRSSPFARCTIFTSVNATSLNLQVKDQGETAPKKARKCHGIPQSFLVKAEAGAKGAMLTSSGEYVMSAVDECVPVEHNSSSCPRHHKQD